MPSWTWYLLLVIASFVLFGYAVFKKRNPKLIVQLFFLSGIIYFFEHIILILLQWPPGNGCCFSAVYGD